MDFSDSMFLFEIVVEELKSYINCKEFYIRSQFADVFTLNLKDPNDLALPRQKRSLKKRRVRNGNSPNQKDIPEGKVQLGQSILLGSTIATLTSNMERFPIELTLWDKNNSENRLGSTHIAWSPVYTEYLHKLSIKQNPAPVFVSDEYNVFDEYTSKRMASIRLNIKLTYLNDKITSSFRSVSEDQKTFMYTGFNSKATTILSTIKDRQTNFMEETGIIKTIYSGAKRKIKTTSRNKSNNTKKAIQASTDKTMKNEPKDEESSKELINPDNKCRVNQSIVSLVKSDTDLKNRQMAVIKTKSCTCVSQDQYNILNYIFGDNKGPYGNQVYCVGYFTVENENSKSPISSESSEKAQSFERSEESPTRSLDLEEAAELITVTNCKQLECNNKKHKDVPPPPDDRILLDFKNLNQECCGVVQTVEEVEGGMKAKMNLNEDKCYCSCECTFGFVTKTTYCGICGGYEKPGEDFSRKPPNAPFPCPVFHKLIDKSKLKSWSTSGSDTKKKPDDGSKNFKGGAKSPGSAKSDKAESEKDTKKGKKKKKDDRFKFNYGYTAAQIGHSQCAMPCTGTLGAVPRNMGWLWTAEDVPGIRFRPMWKPGATNKHVVRLLRMAKNPGQVIAKKKKKDTGKKKSLKRPLLVVQKKDGEYTVTMETMKTYPKPRVVNQYPYEDKPVLTYTIGRTEEENRERRKKKEREQRRLEREQRNFIQSAFKDMCHEICLKTYQQAFGILPNAEDPDCPCYPAHPGADKTNLDLSCSCSEEKSSIGSDTDSDEWVVEFTPPNATFDPTFKGKKVLKGDNSSQYTYLDYKVKLSDRYGNPIPRFFKGPDGRNQCSDLGGFWGPDHKWLEINNDGYIAPDGKWAPMAFIGPNGERVDCDTGKFQTANSKWLVVGIDGYVDCNGRWKSYPRPREVAPQTKPRRTVGGTETAAASKRRGAGDKKDHKVPYKPSEASWSCFGDATPKHLSKMGIVGHGHDKKILLATLKEMLAHGEDVRLPQPSVVPRTPPPKKGKRRHVMSVKEMEALFEERTRCRHPTPSDKGILATDVHGNKSYYKMKEYKNMRPKQRIGNLAQQGISLSSFHRPCFSSFINADMMKQQNYEKIMGTEKKCVSTQVG